MHRSKTNATRAQLKNPVNEQFILQVEDEADDVLFLSIATEAAAITNPIRVVRDGRAAIEFLTAALAKMEDDSLALPRLVLLDLKLPFIPGIDVLRWIRLQPRLRALTVVIFSGSDHPADMDQARDLGATSYLIKPVNFFDLLAFANQVKLWLIEKGPLPASPLWQTRNENAHLSPARLDASQRPLRRLGDGVPLPGCSRNI
jgi:CheY-like chemotaxis protein